MIVSSMTIDRALVLQMDETGNYRVVASSGYPEDRKAKIRPLVHSFPESFFADGYLVANKKDKSGPLEQLRYSLLLPFFVAVPIMRPRLSAILVVGRDREMKPFYPAFDRGDVTNYAAIASFLASIIDNIAGDLMLGTIGEAERLQGSVVCAWGLWCFFDIHVNGPVSACYPTVSESTVRGGCC